MGTGVLRGAARGSLRATFLVWVAAMMLVHDVVFARSVDLPAPGREGTTTVESALRERRSVREFAERRVTIAQVARLLWAAQGITSAGGGRTAPSAGALYPLEIYLAAGRVDGLAAGVYRYLPVPNQLELVIEGDRRGTIGRAAIGQAWIGEAPAVLVIAAVPARTRAKYGTRADRYVAIEAGCAAENVALQAVAIDLATVVVGAFDDRALTEAIGLARGEEPLIVMPFGYSSR